MSERGGSKAFVAAAALWACLPACGSVTPTGGGTSPPTNPWQQATCLVTRTECSGWVVDTNSDRLDNLDVNCGTNNFGPNGGVTATICYQNSAPTPTPAQQQADAANACNQYCASGFNGIYPLGSAANKGGSVTCQSSVVSFANEVAGQCSKTMPPNGGPSPGATTFALCKLSGRACYPTAAVPSGFQTAPDQTTFCVNMQPVVGGEPTSGCFDSTVTTAELMCQHMNFHFPNTPANAVTDAVQFPFWEIDQVELNANTTDCQNEAASFTTAAYGIGPGPMGSFTMNGTTTALTAKGGFAKIGTVCDSETESCVTAIASMKIELADVTISGLTLHNPEATLIAPARANIDTTTIQRDALKLEIEGDITAIGRFRTVFSNPQPLTISTTATTASLTGSFSTTVNTSLQGVAPVTGTLSITGSTSSPNTACANETPLHQLLGFETTADWSSSQVSLALTSSRRTEGCFGLEVGGGNYRTLNSIPFATPLPGTTGTLALDVFNPPNPPNPYWLGAVQMYLTCPAENFFNQYIGQVELTGLPLNKFSTLKYPIPGPIKSMLQGTHSDCFFSIAVNANATPTPPVLDNLRFK